MTEERNCKGLTWLEWLTAAGALVAIGSNTRRFELRSAWRIGADPNDYR